MPSEHNMKIGFMIMTARAKTQPVNEQTVNELVLKSKSKIGELSEDETMYEIEDFEEGVNNVLKDKQEEIEKIQARINQLEEKAKSRGLSEDEAEELEDKQGKLTDLVKNFDSERKTRQGEMQDKISSIKGSLLEAKVLGNETVEAGNIFSKNAREDAVVLGQFFDNRKDTLRKSLIGSVANIIGQKLVDLASKIFNKVSATEKATVNAIGNNQSNSTSATNKQGDTATVDTDTTNQTATEPEIKKEEQGK